MDHTQRNCVLVPRTEDLISVRQFNKPVKQIVFSVDKKGLKLWQVSIPDTVQCQTDQDKNLFEENGVVSLFLHMWEWERVSDSDRTS